MRLAGRVLTAMALWSLASPAHGHETRLAFLEVRALGSGDFVSVLKIPVTGATAWPIEVRLPATCAPRGPRPPLPSIGQSRRRATVLLRRGRRRAGHGARGPRGRLRRRPRARRGRARQPVDPRGVGRVDPDPVESGLGGGLGPARARRRAHPGRRRSPPVRRRHDPARPRAAPPPRHHHRVHHRALHHPRDDRPRRGAGAGPARRGVHRPLDRLSGVRDPAARRRGNRLGQAVDRWRSRSG